SALTVGNDLSRKRAADMFEGGGELAMSFCVCGDGGGSGGAISQDKKRVVGGRVTINADRVEGPAGNIAQSFLEQRRRNVGIGSDEGESSGHVGVNHAGAFGATDEVNTLAGHAERGGGGFGASVSGANGEREFSEGTGRGAAIAREHRERAQNFFYRKLNADDARGADKDFVNWKAEALGGFFDRAKGS